MDKRHSNSTKKNKKKINKSQTKKQKNHQNETEEKLAITTENELITKDDNDNLQDISNIYKNLGILISNKLQSLENNQQNINTSLLFKTQNDLSNLIKQRSNFSKQSDLKTFMHITNNEKSVEATNQSNSLLLNKDTNNYKELNSLNLLNKSMKKDSNNKLLNNSKIVQKKTINKYTSNSLSNSYISNNQSSKKITHRNSNKVINNQILCFQKSESQIKTIDFHEENHSRNKQKHITKKKKNIKNRFKKSLSSDNFPNIFRTLKSPKYNTPKIQKRDNISISPPTPTSRFNKNLYINSKLKNNLTPTNGIHSLFLNEKKPKFQRKKIKIPTVSNFTQECKNNYKTFFKKKMRSKTILISNKIKRENLYNTILLSNNPTEIKDANKIMSIITMDEVNKKIKESLDQYDKKELIKEIRDLETNDICDAIDKLPINSNSISFDNKSKNEDNNSNKTKYTKNKKLRKFYHDSSKKKLMALDEKFRKIIHKELVYDSLDDDEMEEIEINLCYISPNSIKAYLIDSIILLSSIIQLIYLPLFLAFNFEFCRDRFSVNQLMFYLVDLFYILDLITGFFRAYYNFDEFLIRNRYKIFKNYLNNWFFIDFLEAIPLYIIFNSMENKCKINDIFFSIHYNKNINRLHYILLLIKSLKIFKVFSANILLKKLKNKLNDYDFFFEYKTILFTIFIVFSSLNISSCLFIFLGRNTYPGWIVEFNMQNSSFSYIYLISNYYLMTSVTTVGYGDIKCTSIAERIYQIIILLVGTCAYSWAITYISNYVKKIQEKSINLEKKIDILEDIKLSNENFSKELYDKTHRYLQYNCDDRKTNNEILIDCLPYPLNNNLFMEMYKNIIKNFKFFKSFENSNFIVKVVTSFKPVLSIKNDILVQEGDFIEDIIFVKEGILSLEVCIDLDCAQESIEAFLTEGSFGKSIKLIKEKINKKFETHLYSFKNNFSHNELKFKNILSSFTKKETNKINKKYLRILDIRKNEYYGDILMFLNERAPLRVKVKSKKAELFYLNKTDAIEISTLYPNIWKRIIQKSLFNMKQIKSLTRKILIYFSKLNGIFLNEEVCKDINSPDSSTQVSNFFNENQTIENTNRSSISKSKEEENDAITNLNNTFSSVIYEEENENIETPLAHTKINNEFKEINKGNTQKSNFNNMKINNNNNNNVSKKSIKNINNNKDLQLKFNTDIRQTFKKFNLESSNNFLNQKTEKISISNNVNSFSDYLENKNFCFSISNEFEINSEIYPNENFNGNIFLQSDYSGSNINSKDIDKEKNIDKKLILKNIDSDFDFDHENEKNNEDDSNSFKTNENKIKKFENLSIVSTITTNISSIYENLNQISKNKFSKDINLRKKTIQFLIEESSKKISNNSVVDKYFTPKNKISNPLNICRNSKNCLDTVPKFKVKSKNSNYDVKHPTMTSLNKEEPLDMKSIVQMKRKSSKFSRGSFKFMSPEINKSIIYKKSHGMCKSPNHHKSMKNLKNNEPENLFENERKKYYKKKESMKNLTNFQEEQELNFYGKMKTLRDNNNTTTNKITTINNDEIVKSPTKKNYLDMISHNILEDRQTLNNPQEFYMGFFTNIVQKKINKRKKSIKVKKDIYKKKSGDINKSRHRSNKYLIDNNDKLKIKNKRTFKRPYSSNNVIKQAFDY